MEKFARRCDITGRGMNEGYCFGDGEQYACDEASALQIAQQYGYDNLDDAYKDDAYYYTEWSEYDIDDEYFDAEGNEFNN
jgi:hypothetical protein